MARRYRKDLNPLTRLQHWLAPSRMSTVCGLLTNNSNLQYTNDMAHPRLCPRCESILLAPPEREPEGTQERLL